MKDRAKGLEKVAVTGDAQQLPPGTTIGMAMSAEIPPAHPAPRGTVRVRAKMRRGVHLAAAPPRGHDARRRGVGCLWAKVAAVLTGITVRLGGQARQGLGHTVALGHWGCGLRCRRARDGGVTRPHSM